eukprot:scaffold1845_cov291-Prasinococcus_capsulatus_cf.AAC.5
MSADDVLHFASTFRPRPAPPAKKIGHWEEPLPMLPKLSVAAAPSPTPPPLSSSPPPPSPWSPCRGRLLAPCGPHAAARLGVMVIAARDGGVAWRRLLLDSGGRVAAAGGLVAVGGGHRQLALGALALLPALDSRRRAAGELLLAGLRKNAANELSAWGAQQGLSRSPHDACECGSASPLSGQKLTGVVCGGSFRPAQEQIGPSNGYTCCALPYSRP